MFVVLLLILFTAVVSTEVVVNDQEEYVQSGFYGKKPAFDKIMYTAKIVGNKVVINEEPLTLLNCGIYDFGIRVKIANSSSFSLITTANRTSSETYCPLLFQFSANHLNSSRIGDNLFNIVIVQAVYGPYIVAEANITAFSSPSFSIYDLNGETYVILNSVWSIVLLVYFIITVLIGLTCVIWTWRKKI
ncbi:hypothetical protein NQ318_020596 [Aromia moschata]|uniref:Uncharacterized protein n=1 Tax=Aromia moschata TaxID=1265417 RepID=A0AAV8Z0M6_9CUCU|nr:hypothetical protein NQ318_020596 [Aromia moschata]